MLLLVTASAPESVGGSLAALGAFDALRASVPTAAAATGDPLGIFYRTHMDTTSSDLATPKTPVAILPDLECVVPWAAETNAPAAVVDATGDLRRDVRAWPDQLVHLRREPARTVLFIAANDTDGAQHWIDSLATEHPSVFEITVILSYPIGQSRSLHRVAGRHTMPAPILHHSAVARMNAQHLSPAEFISYRGPDASPTDQERTRAWLAEWTAILNPILSELNLLPKDLHHASTRLHVD